ncbi:MAG TPA: hypothetical protein VEL05_11425, partial [Candidatus Acidoferrum sp.]|nr:hypothetical protein [Candidatus Acidoferrum sp.]
MPIALLIVTAVCSVLLACGEIRDNPDAAPPEIDATAIDRDRDDDGIDDEVDNCPDVSNPGQEDSDGQPVGTATAIPFLFRPSPATVAIDEFSNLALADEGMTAPLEIFPFTFFGTTYHQVRINSNGLLILGPD